MLIPFVFLFLGDDCIPLYALGRLSSTLYLILSLCVYLSKKKIRFSMCSFFT